MLCGRDLAGRLLGSPGHVAEEIGPVVLHGRTLGTGVRRMTGISTIRTRTGSHLSELCGWSGPDELVGLDGIDRGNTITGGPDGVDPEGAESRLIGL